ncbi:MAG TPA: MarR family winged helix-turn-helix transcriptional regulator [Candidatus Saccharimonadales bacterium]|nr:MarR family winged helix-turn-helix transcriptional regulator [Candidatus Saccharimonadales bacterium]
MESANDLGYLFQHVASILAKRSDQELQEVLGIGYSQLKLLLALQDKPYLKQRDIASDLGQTEASISRQVKLMIDQGILQVTINPKNRREHLTQVTPKGDRITAAALETLKKYHEPIFATLGSKQRSQLQEIFQDLHVQVCSQDHEPKAEPEVA